MQPIQYTGKESARTMQETPNTGKESVRMKQATESMKQYRKIDAHSHIGMFGGWANVNISAEQLIAQMNEYNIEKTVISTFPARESLEAAERYSDRLLCALWVNPTEGNAALDQVNRLAANYKICGIKLHPLAQAYPANDPCVFPIAELAEEWKLPLMIHSGHAPFSLPWSIAQLAERYPNVKVLMIHMGHGNGMYIQAAIDMAKAYPNIYLETSGMPMHTKIFEAYQTVGSHRIMFGIDAPFHHPSVEIQKALVSGLSHEELKNFFENNARKFLGLETEHS